MEIPEKVRNSPYPAVPETREPMVNRFGVGDDVGNSVRSLCKISLESRKGLWV